MIITSTTENEPTVVVTVQDTLNHDYTTHPVPLISHPKKETIASKHKARKKCFILKHFQLLAKKKQNSTEDKMTVKS